jgi:hypothetical protein
MTWLMRRNIPWSVLILLPLWIVALAALGGCSHRARYAVTTYHYNNLRTGWNRHEDRLTPNRVASSHFGVLYAPTTLDDQVDAQPLVVPNERIQGRSRWRRYEVVYVATESNTVYAINARSGKVLLIRNLGPAVPLNTASPPSPMPPAYGCGNNGPYVGINGTPVIDRASNTMYLIAYTMENGAPVYRLHALDLSDLTDRVPAVTVAGSRALKNGTVFHFDPGWQRQRPGLVLSRGNLYAAFGSFCDWGDGQSRGWVLGWKTPSLTPLAADQLNNRLATTPTGMFLSSVWMSGYGVAADASGSLYFVTGNSDPSGTTYDGVDNIPESVVKMSSNLTTMQSIFTPSDQSGLDIGDTDFGSGGVMLLPRQSGPVPRLAAAAGKEGNLFLMNRNSLGGYSTSTNNVLATVAVGGCWCGPSYFESHGAYIVSSGGANVKVWKLRTSPSVSLTLVGTSAPVAGYGGGGDDGGFFTSVSSRGSQHAIIWAVSRPDAPGNLWLYAFEALPGGASSTLRQLFAQSVGTWAGGNSNVVPVVANGKVFVATDRKLTIFGLR